MPRLKTAFLFLAAVALFAPAALAHNVPAGYDLLQTVPNLTYKNFSGPFTIPAGFFDPGSEPFTGVVPLQGRPIPGHPACGAFPLGNVDTIVERKADAVLPGPPSMDTIPIELVQLSLVSVSPIVVTYSGGGSELWDLRIEPSPTVPSTGSMTIRKTHPNGGTFDAQLTVYPLLTFTRVSPPDFVVREFDGGLAGLPDQLSASGVPWVHEAAGLSCTLCGVNFVPGVEQPNQVTVWTEAGQWAAHGVQPPCTPPVPVEETTWGYIRSLYAE